MLRDRTFYTPLANDEAYNGARFRGGTIYKLSQNCDHFVASRGRVVVKDGPCVKPLSVVDTAVTREYVFDRREQENVLYARATWVANDFWEDDPTQITWRIDTDDTTGTHGSTGEDEQTDILDFTSDDAAFRRFFPGSSLPVQWPRQLGTVFYPWMWPIQSQWQKHTIPSTTNLPGTVVEFVFQSPSIIAQVGLRSLTVVAVREEDPT